MNRVLFLILLVLFTLPVFAQRKFTKVDFHVNGIGSGTSYSTVVKKLGKPLRRKTEKIKASNACSNLAETHLTLFYSGLEITLLGFGKGNNPDVYSVIVTSPKWTASGIKVGAEAKDVLAKFRSPNSKVEESGETTFYYSTKSETGRLNCYFRNNKLVRIDMTEMLC